eukprot:gene19962-25931_t
MSLSADSDRLIANFTDLYDNNEEIQYATAKEAFLDQSILKFVMDELERLRYLKKGNYELKEYTQLWV